MNKSLISMIDDIYFLHITISNIICHSNNIHQIKKTSRCPRDKNSWHEEKFPEPQSKSSLRRM